MIISCNKNFIDLPSANDGFCLDENNVFSIEYFSGSPYPENIAELICENNNNNNDLESDDENSDVCSSDDDLENDEED